MQIIKSLLNPFYLLAVVFGVALYVFSTKQQEQTELFFGFAQNNETEINLDYPVRVEKLLVKPGDFIKNGASLATLSQLNLSKEISDEELRINELTTEYRQRVNILNGKIDLAKDELQRRVRAIDDEIAVIETKQRYSEQLKDGLSTLSNKDDNGSDQIIMQSIEQLRGKKELIKGEHETEITVINKQINDERKVYQAAVDRHKSDVGFAQEKLRKLDLISPSDALIGNVHVREGEFVKSFEPMVTLYEPNPTSVAGYVHESMLVNVRVGDEFTVRSFHTPENQCLGKVTGLGSRIVEVPGRLRKNPEFKTYGREVLISIPTDNKLLQKEKVIVYFN